MENTRKTILFNCRSNSWEKRLAEGHHCNVSTWALNAHTGTHIDAPLHFGVLHVLPVSSVVSQRSFQKPKFIRRSRASQATPLQDAQFSNVGALLGGARGPNGFCKNSMTHDTSTW